MTKIKCIETTPAKIRMVHGNDWSNLIFVNKLNLFGKSLKNIILPKNKKFFIDNLEGKCMSGTELPCIDFNDYDMTDILVHRVHFHEDTIFPKRKDFFKEVRNSDWVGCILPKGNYNCYDFTDVNLTDVEFSKEADIFEQTELFQLIKGRRLKGMILPEGDYSNFNFNKVNIEHSVFTKNSKLPNDTELFRKLARKSIAMVAMPEMDYSDYNFKNVDITGTVFTVKSRVSRNKDFFKMLKNRSYIPTQMPCLDMNDYDMSNDCTICGFLFTKDSIIPKDKTFFEGKFLHDITLPEGDYSEYSFKETSLNTVKFTENSVLPKSFFKEINKVLCVTLPNMNLNEFEIDFKRLSLKYVRFTENSIFFKDKDIFQKIVDKNLVGTRLPASDYSQYNFDGVDIRGCDFSNKSKLPQDINFFQKIKNRNTESVEFPDNIDFSIYNLNKVFFDYCFDIESHIIRNILAYDLNDFERLDFSLSKFNNKLTKSEIDVLKIRYEEKILDRSLLLPKKVKENKTKLKVTKKLDELI